MQDCEKMVVGGAMYATATVIARRDKWKRGTYFSSLALRFGAGTSTERLKTTDAVDSCFDR
jgi:hypothetical protein